MTQVASRLGELELGSEILGGHDAAASETTASDHIGQDGAGDGTSRLLVLVRSGENIVGGLRNLEGHRSGILSRIAHHLGIVVDGAAHAVAELRLEMNELCLCLRKIGGYSPKRRTGQVQVRDTDAY